MILLHQTKSICKHKPYKPEATSSRLILKHVCFGIFRKHRNNNRGPGHPLQPTFIHPIGIHVAFMHYTAYFKWNLTIKNGVIYYNKG